MDLEEEEFDNVVPLEVLNEFIATWLIGFVIWFTVRPPGL